jgi:thiamine biosynthesis lipoprotein
MPARRVAFKAMGSPCELHLYAESESQHAAVAAAARAEIDRLERKYSRYREDSLAARINASAGEDAGIRVDDETAALFDYAAMAWEQSGGLFDITSGVLRRAWDFRAGRLPAPAEIEALRPLVGWEKVRWRRPQLRLPLPGMELDFGGYVKEYAADRVAELCRQRGLRHGLVDLGGDLAVVGPHPDGSPWRVGIRNPRAPQGAVAAVALAAGGIATSGDYERCMIVDGVRYAHILDPRTGRPVAGLASVSVVAAHCLVAGTASTVAMLKGSLEGPVWLDRLGLPSLRIDANGEISGALASGTSERG